tara:strand:+ start:363 stop:536 length:174 start_codon:yes stop_codon:yes gene_type:complete
MSPEIVYVLKTIDEMMSEYNDIIKEAMEAGYPLGAQLKHERMTALKVLRDRIKAQYE